MFDIVDSFLPTDQVSTETGQVQRIRKRIEEVFGWVKVPGGQAKTKFRGQPRVEASFTLGLAAYNLIRLPRLLAETAP